MSNADLLAASPDYLKTYSLTCEPFANDLDGRFFYAGSALMQRLDLLTHLAQFGDSVILVSGPRGSGKTTLLGRFVGQAGSQWRLCLINADEFDQFQQRLGDALGSADSDDELKILERWASQTETSQLLVIVIDNSEQLQPDAFQKLCTLLLPPLAERVRLILFGTPDAQQTLKQSFDQKELPCSAQLLEVPRLSEEETASYLMYRLAVAGFSGESPFTATEVRALCKAADGRPADINRLAHEALLEHQMRTRGRRLRPRKKTRKGISVIWALASVLVVGVATYLGWHRLQPVLESPLAGQETRDIPLALPKPTPGTVQRKTPSTPTPAATEPALPATPVEMPATAETPPPTQVVDTAKAPPAPVASPKPTTPEPLMLESAGPPPPPEDSRPESPPPQATGTAPTVAAPRAAAAAQPTKPAPATDATTTPKNAVPRSSPAVSPATGLPHRENWLLLQAPQHYSLQLLGSRKAGSITDYIREHHLNADQSAFYRGQYRGGEWYVLMYGIYPNRKAALDARATLPAKVRKDKPWPRTLKAVQAAIREAR